jgi:hypothetical protein
VAALSGARVRDCKIQYRGRRLNFCFWRFAANRVSKNIQKDRMNPALETEDNLDGFKGFVLALLDECDTINYP